MKNSTLSLAGAGQVWDLCLCFPLIDLFCVFCDWERSVVQLREMRQLSFSKTLKSFFSWEINFEQECVSWVLNCLLKICICKLTCLSCVSSPILFSVLWAHCSFLGLSPGSPAILQKPRSLHRFPLTQLTCPLSTCAQRSSSYCLFTHFPFILL